MDPLRRLGASRRTPPKGTPPRAGSRTPPPSPQSEKPAARGRVKYVELIGSVSAIGAEVYSNVIDYEVPAGHCLEIFAVGGIPDLTIDHTASRAEKVLIAADKKEFLGPLSFNHLGRNALPWGDRASRRPVLLIDAPLKRGNLTAKFNEKQTAQVRVYAGATAVATTLRVRACGYLLEESDAKAIYGVGVNGFAGLGGGNLQSLPVLPFFDYALNAATAGTGKFEQVYEEDIPDYAEVKLTHIGVKTHLNADTLRIVDHAKKVEVPEYEPYFTIREVCNELPFGDDEDFQGPFELPDEAKLTYTNTKLQVWVKDLAAVIPARGAAVQLRGIYRKVR